MGHSTTGDMFGPGLASTGKTSYIWVPCGDCEESPWPGILFPCADGNIQACGDCHVYVSSDGEGGFIVDDEAAANALLVYLKDRHGHELELEWDEEEGWFFEGFTFDDGFQFYSNFRSHVPGNLHPPIAPAFATWWDKKERKAAAFALETHKKVANRQQLRDAIKEIGIPESVLAQEARKHEHQRIPSPMSKGEIEAEECSIRDENVRLWDLLKRTRKHRDKLLRNLRNEISDIHAGKFMAKMGRTRDHIDKLHTEINKLEQRKLELKATIMMMGGSEYK